MSRIWQTIINGFGIILVFFVLASIGGLSTELGLLYGMGPSDLSFLNVINNGALLIAGLMVGPMALHFGEKRLIVTGAVLMTVGSCVFFVVQKDFLIISRVLLGFGVGIVYNASVSYLSACLSKKAFAFSLGAISTIAAIFSGLAAGPLAEFIRAFGFQTYVLVHTIACIVFLCGAFLLPRMSQVGEHLSLRESYADMWHYIKDPQVFSAAYSSATAGVVRAILAAVYVFPYMNIIHHGSIDDALRNEAAAFIVMFGNALGQLIWPIVCVNTISPKRLMMTACLAMSVCLLIFMGSMNIWIENVLLLVIGVFSGGMGSVYAVYIRDAVPAQQYPACLAVMFVVAGVLMTALQFFLGMLFYAFEGLEGYTAVFGVIIAVFLTGAWAARSMRS